MFETSAEMIRGWLSSGIRVRETRMLPHGEVFVLNGVLYVSMFRYVQEPIAKPKRSHRLRCSTRAAKTADRKALRAWARHPYETVLDRFGVDGLLKLLNAPPFARSRPTIVQQDELDARRPDAIMFDELAENPHQ